MKLIVDIWLRDSNENLIFILYIEMILRIMLRESQKPDAK
jgi:hypothetical protein